MPWEHTLTVFVITAAFLLVAGSIFLRLQRDRHHFLLMQAALEKGLTSFPGVTAGWLISLRIGIMIFVLGLGLVGSGIALYATANMIDVPPSPPAATAPARPASDPSTRPNIAMEGLAPPPPSAPQRGQARPSEPPQPPAGPPPNPEMDRWRRVQNQNLAALAATCAGGILMLLGVVRMIFARLERIYTAESPPSSA